MKLSLREFEQTYPDEVFWGPGPGNVYTRKRTVEDAILVNYWDVVHDEATKAL